MRESLLEKYWPDRGVMDRKGINRACRILMGGGILSICVAYIGGILSEVDFWVNVILAIYIIACAFYFILNRD